MNKKDFITKVKNFLGEDVDPLALKKQLSDDIGFMSYEDAWTFIQGTEESANALKDLKKLTEDVWDGRATSATPTIDGVPISANNIRRHDRVTENIIIRKELK